MRRFVDGLWPRTVGGMPLMGWRWVLAGVALSTVTKGAGLTIVAVIWGHVQARKLAKRDRANFLGRQAAKEAERCAQRVLDEVNRL